MDQLWKRLESWQHNLENNTDTETYLKICEQTGEEPNPDKIPPTLEDFPYDVQAAIIVFSKLGDRVEGNVGYLGKDFTTLPLHMKIMKVDNEEIFLETLLKLDQRLIERSAQELQRERERIKNKH